ncbi:MAG TPA: SIMPL domain-containing protein [Phenylobacterium sp.]|nr:SIMPL domain-containing protein [Phenylobacterium sp.]
MKTLMRTAALAAVLAGGAMAAAPAVAQVQPAADAMFQATTLNLSAFGEVKVAPDMAMITLGVLTEAPTAAAAMQANAQKMTEVVATLKKAGIAERDIQTSNLNLNPQYVYVQNEQPRLTGYQASNQVTITVRDLKKLGPAVDASVNAGANQVQGISFGLTDATEAENEARRKAVKALSDKAALYAGATGHRVQRLVTLSEGGGYAAPPPMPLMRFKNEAMMADAANSPVSPGELRVRIDVSGMYELGR